MTRGITNDASAITPSDSADLAQAGVVFVGTGGAIKVTTLKGTEITFGNVPDGYELKCEVKKVFSTGTTATNLVLYHDS